MATCDPVDYKMDYFLVISNPISRKPLITNSGDPYENRTRITSVKGTCPNR